MKFTKRMLATLLTLALAFALALPATAAVNWDEFKITKQPQDLTIKHGDSFTLSIEVAVPAGVEVEYQWYRSPFAGSENDSTRISGATTSLLQLSNTDTNYPPVRNSYYIYHCEITAYEKDTSGTEISSKARTSDKARVTVEEKEKNFWDKVFDITIAPFGIAAGMTLTTITMSFGLAIPFSPLVFLYYLFEGFIIGFRGLF